MRINLSTRILHFSMIVVVLYQLFSSLWMVMPEPGKMTDYATVLYTLHISFFGWIAPILGGAYALIRFSDSNAWQRLMPWFSVSGLKAFARSARNELPSVFKGHLAPPEDRGALAGAVHGLGFLLLIALGLTGLYVLSGLRADGTMRDDILLVLDFHELFGVLVWTFLGAHVAMTLYHLLLGQRKVLDIFQRGRIRWR